MQFPTLKRCVGFLELYKKSVSLECWGDIKYEVTPNNGYKYYFSNGTAQEHHDYQRGEGYFYMLHKGVCVCVGTIFRVGREGCV